MTCLYLALGFLCMSGPKMTPAQAAALLKPNQFQVSAPAPTGPSVVSTGATSATLGPWEFPTPPAPRRLDGTLLSDPVQVYGAPLLLVLPIYTAR